MLSAPNPNVFGMEKKTLEVRASQRSRLVSLPEVLLLGRSFSVALFGVVGSALLEREEPG